MYFEYDGEHAHACRLLYSSPPSLNLYTGSLDREGEVEGLNNKLCVVNKCTKFMDSLSTQLHDTLCLLDQVYREGGCGILLMTRVGELYDVVDSLGELHCLKLKSVTQFITEKTPQWFQECETFYCQLYLMVYSAMEKSRNIHQQQLPPLKMNGVPIDPQCPLNMIDPTPYSKMTILLHNDNETLAKYPPSSLYSITGIGPKIADLETYYENQCSRLYTNYLSHYDEIQTNIKEWNMIEIIREKVTSILIMCGTLVLQPLKESLRELEKKVIELMTYQRTLEENCTSYRNNVLKWFMVGVQLKDNMLKSYNLTHAHQKSSYIGPVF